MIGVLEQIYRFVWGVPALLLILGVGIYLSVRTGLAQIILFPRALRSFFVKLRRKKNSDATVSPYQALCTALAATVGTGNLAGVAGAIAIGGPGAVFWMWICAVLGMVTKFAEATLAVRYRTEDMNGEMVGGPMYMITRGMGSRWNWLAGLYCFFGVVASFGVGNATQINVMISGVDTALVSLGIGLPACSKLLFGTVIAILVGVMLSGGAKRIGEIAEQLVPFASAAYIILAAGILISRMDQIPQAFSAIVYGAFRPQAVTGGVLGSSFTALRIGAARGVFTNEAGMGTASIAHAAADVAHPVEQGLMGIMEVFLDTIVICTMTALTVLCSGVSIPYGTDAGILLTTDAFSTVYGDWVCVPISLFLCCFAIATVLGWGLYGARCAQFLFGASAWKPFVWMQVMMVIVGAALNTQTVWLLAETVNGLMAIPNLITLAVLTPELAKMTKDYRKWIRQRAAEGGTYENFYQRKPLRTVSNAEVSSSGGEGKGCRQENLSLEYRTAGY